MTPFSLRECMHDAEREPVHERQYAVGRALGLCA